MFSRLDLPPILAQQRKQRRKIRGFLQERPVNGTAKLLPLGRLRLIPQPLIVRPSTSLRVFHNGQTVLHAQGIAEALDGFGGTPEVAELPVTVQINRMDNDVVMEPNLSRTFLTFSQSDC